MKLKQAVLGNEQLDGKPRLGRKEIQLVCALQDSPFQAHPLSDTS